MELKLQESDYRAIEQLQSLFPEKVFDAHFHISHMDNEPYGIAEFLKYHKQVFPCTKTVYGNAIVMPVADMAERSNGLREQSTRFLKQELDKHPNFVGEAIVLPDDTVDDIENLLIHKRIRGLKCYHLFAKMILAHCARAFASWTVMENAARFKDVPNVYFDISAICESPAIFECVRSVGVNRVLWGSDFPISTLIGKPVSIADTFLWLYEKDLRKIPSRTDFRINMVAVAEKRFSCDHADISNSGTYRGNRGPLPESHRRGVC